MTMGEIAATATTETDAAPPDAKKPPGSPWWFWNPSRALCRVITSVWFDFKVHGLEHLPKSGGAILICNHQSVLDPVFLGAQMRRQISFIAKVELFQPPGLGWLIRMLNTLPVRRGEADVTAIREALRRVHEGQILAMYPEGTRSKTGELLPIQAGVGLMIKRADAPVIPAVVDGAYRAWPKGNKLPTGARVRLMYGPPLAVKDMKGGQIVKEIEKTFAGMMAQLRRMYPDLIAK
jgi:1-acyl-sn-glycerol-3-phosphate acyltransferase